MMGQLSNAKSLLEAGEDRSLPGTGQPSEESASQPESDLSDKQSLPEETSEAAI